MTDTGAGGAHAHPLPPSYDQALLDLADARSRLSRAETKIGDVERRISDIDARVHALEGATPEPDPEPGPDPTEPPGLIWCPVTPTLDRDLSAEIRSWIIATAAPDRVLGFHPVPYRTDARMQLAVDWVSLWSRGGLFRRIDEAAGSPILEFKGADDVDLDGLRITGPDGTIAYNTTASFTRQGQHALALISTRRVAVRGLSVLGVYGDAVYIERSDSLGIVPEDITIEGLDADILGRNGVSLINGRRIELRDSVIRGAKLHSFDVEPNDTDGVIEDLRIVRLRSERSDMGQTSSGPGYAIAIGGGYGKVAAHRVTIEGLSLDRTGRTGRAAVYVVGPSSANPHTDVSLTGTRCDELSTADIRNVSGLVYSDNDGLVAL